MSLAEVIMRGLEFSHPLATTPMPVDLVAADVVEKRTMIAKPDWWWSDWGDGASFLFLEGIFVREPTPVNREPVYWNITGGDSVSAGAMLVPLADAQSEARLKAMRRREDLYRTAYLRELQSLRESAGNFNTDAWVEAFLERPIVDPIGEFREKHLGRRKIGRLFLLDQDNKRVDALLIDAHGNAATAGGDEFLESLGMQWAEPPRPEMEAFLEWAITQTAYGSYTLDAPVIHEQEGFLEDLAIQAVS